MVVAGRSAKADRPNHTSPKAAGDFVLGMKVSSALQRAAGEDISEISELRTTNSGSESPLCSFWVKERTLNLAPTLCGNVDINELFYTTVPAVLNLAEQYFK